MNQNTDRINLLASLCKGSVTITINPHRDNYQTIEEYIGEEEQKEIVVEVMEQMINRDFLMVIQVYPDTPNGFYRVYHYDINMALNTLITEIQLKKMIVK